MLYAGIFRSAMPQAIPSAFRIPEEPGIDEDALRRACRDLARELECHECLIGPRAYEDAELAERFIREVTS